MALAADGCRWRHRSRPSGLGRVAAVTGVGSHLGSCLRRASSAGRRARRKRMLIGRNALGRYVQERPSPQAAVNLFRGEWASRLPPPVDGLHAGTIDLPHDERIAWAIEHLGGVEGLRVVELGPLEASHTYMLEQAGAQSVRAIEGNAGAFLRCLIVKELVPLTRSTFQCGDFVAYLEQEQTPYDLCLASGVLYHMVEPVRLLQLVARCAPRAIIWSHYYERAIVEAHPRLRRRMRHEPRPAEHVGYPHMVHRHDYGYSLLAAGFCGGPSRYANWLSREDLLGALEFFGFSRIEVRDDPQHVNGPALTLAVSKE